MTDNKEWINKEFILAKKMKESYCDELGKEKEPAKAAEIIHEIGVIYRKRTPDKIALLKSVGLFNAAIVRNPSNIARIKFDLSEICQHILQKAGAKIQNVSLMKKAELDKIQAQNMRTKINASLQDLTINLPSDPTANDAQKLMLQKISVFRTINKTITNKYKEIMADISQFCENVMGDPPCEYVIVGMGSLAREEITPYSDFEHIILLSDGKKWANHLKFFRWFSVIFHVIVLNLQETIIPSMNINKLNGKDCKLGNWFRDFTTPRGISFDGMMPHACKFPLGRTQDTELKPFKIELIKPVSEMLNYLSSEADLKNGYHLADMLTKICFVFGNKSIFKQFVNGIHNYRHKKSISETITSIKQQVKDDLKKFSIRFQLSKLQSQNKINIKQFVYRSTSLFVSALGRIFNISANSSFEIIDKIKKLKKISQSTAIKLQYAIAISSEIRLKTYMKSKSQNDYAIDLNQNNAMEQFLSIAGAASTINYFQIVYCLQFEIVKQLKSLKHSFYSDPHLLNITISLAFGISNLTNFSKISKNCIKNSIEFEFDTCIDELEKDVNRKVSTIKPTTFLFTLNTDQIRNIAHHLYSINKFDEALEFFEKLQKRSHCYSKGHNRNDYVVPSDQSDLKKVTHYKDFDALDNTLNSDINPETLQKIGYCHIQLFNYTDALTFLNRALEIHQNTMLNDSKSRNFATLLNNIGVCHMHLSNNTDALTFLNRALEIYQNVSLNNGEGRNIGNTFNNIGVCQKNLGKYTNALTFPNRALEIYQNSTLNDSENHIATTLNNIEICHMNLCNYNDALVSLNRALAIEQNTTLNESKDSNIAITLINIGLCYINLCKHINALTFLNRALEMKQNTTLNDSEDSSIANTLNNIGCCHMYLNNYTDALTFLNRALEIQQNTTLNNSEDQNIATTLNNIGVCHKKLSNYTDALTFLNRALKIDQNTTLNDSKNRSIATTLNNIGFCHRNLCNYSDALTFLNRALKIFQNATLNDSEDSHIAMTLNNIALCHMNLCHYIDALTFLNRALKIFQNATLNDSEDSHIAIMLNNIALCHMNLCNYIDALTFLNRALKIFQNATLNASKDSNIAMTLNNIGTCHMYLSSFIDALTFLNRALEIFQNTMLNDSEERNIATLLYNIGTCQVYLGNYTDALTFLNRSHEIEQNTKLRSVAKKTVPNFVGNDANC